MKQNFKLQNRIFGLIFVFDNSQNIRIHMTVYHPNFNRKSEIELGYGTFDFFVLIDNAITFFIKFKGLRIIVFRSTHLTVFRCFPAATQF